MTRLAALGAGALWLVLLLAADVALALRPENLEHHLGAFLAEELASRVEYDGLEVALFGDVVLERVRVYRPELPDELLLKVQEVRVALDWPAILAGRPRASLVSLRRPHLVLAWDAAARMAIPSPFRPDEEPSVRDLPRVEVSGLQLRLVNSPYLAGPDELLDFEDLRIRLVPDASPEWLYYVEGSVKDPLVGELHAHGRLAESDYQLTLERRGFGLTDGMRSYLDPDVARFLGELELAGGVEIRSRFFREAETGSAAFEIGVRFDGASIGFRTWPQRVTGLEGEVRYRDGRFHGDGLTGWCEGGRLVFGGQVDLTHKDPVVEIDGQLLSLQLTSELVERLESLPHPGKEVAEQLRQFEVRGPADVAFRLEQRRGEALHPRVKVDLRGCDFAYQGPPSGTGGRREGFPYRVAGLRGLIELDDVGLAFDRLTAEKGGVGVQARGRVDYSRAGDETYDVTIAVTGLPIDEDLFAALEAPVRDTLRSFAATGTVDAKVEVQRSRQDPVDVDPDIEIALNGVQLRPEVFPYRLEDVRGRIKVEDDEIRVPTVLARHGPATLRFDGWIGVGAKAEQLRLQVGVEALAMDEDLFAAAAVPLPEVAAAVRALDVAGEVGLQIGLSRAEAGLPLGVDGTVTLRGVSLSPDEPPVEIEEVDGLLAIERDEVRILPGMTGRFSGERFKASGGFRIDHGYQLVFEASDLQVGPRLLDALARFVPALEDPARRPMVEGRASAVVTVEDQGEGPPTLAAEVHARGGLRLRPPSWPEDLVLEDIYCDLVAREGTVQGRGLLARIRRSPGGATPEVPASGVLYGGERDIELSVSAVTLLEDRERGIGVALGGLEIHRAPIDDQLLRALGFGGQGGGLGVPVGGTFSLSLSSALFSGDEVLLSDGTLTLEGLLIGTQGGIAIERVRIAGFGGALSPGQTTLDGQASMTNVRVLGVVVPRLSGRLSGDGDGLAIAGIEGDLFGYQDGDAREPYGRIRGEDTSFGIRFETGEFGLDARLEQVRLESAVRALGGRPTHVRGELKMDLGLSGFAGDAGSLRGVGKVQAQAVNVVDLPLFLNIMKALDISSLMASSPRSDIKVDFTVSDRLVRLTRATLDSSDLALSGSGAITFDGVIHAVFDVSHKGRIPLLSDIIGLVPSLILSGVEVEGPLEDPKVIARSFGMGADSKVPEGRRPKAKPLKE